MVEKSGSEWQRGWIVALVSMLGLAISTTPLYTMGVFIGPIEQDLGWTRSQITSGMLINSVIAVVLAPFVGLMIDRYGIRKMGLPGMTVYSIGFILLGLTGTAYGQWLLIWLVVACGSLLIKPTIWTAAVSRQFDKQRALALAVMLSGSGVASAVLPWLSNNLIEAYGWRGAYVALGGGFLVVAVPLMFFFLGRSGFAGRVSEPSRAELPGLPIREAMLSTRFLRIALAALVMTIAMAGLNVHFVAFTTGEGLTKNSAVWAASCMGLASIAGRFITGYLLDRFHGPLIGGVSFALPLVACFLWLQFDGSIASAVIIAIAIGLALGAEIDIIAYLGTRYFGLKNYGTIFGTIAGLLAFGAGVGPNLAGRIYDTTKSYDLFIWGSIPAFLLAAVMIATLGRYPDFSKDVDEIDVETAEAALS